MKCLLIYDIPDDNVRTKIANFCLDYGLDRVQYSAFLGDLSTNHQEELMLKIEAKLGKDAGKIRSLSHLQTRLAGEDEEQAAAMVRNIAAISLVVSGSCGHGHMMGQGPDGHRNRTSPQSPARLPTSPNMPELRPRSS